MTEPVTAQGRRCWSSGSSHGKAGTVVQREGALLWHVDNPKELEAASRKVRLGSSLRLISKEEKFFLLAGKSKAARSEHGEPKNPNFDIGFKFYHQKNFHFPDLPMYKYTHTYTYICRYVYAYIMCEYIHIHTYIHTHTKW